MYPSCYVFVVQDDVTNAMVQQSNFNALSPMPMAATPGPAYPTATAGLRSFILWNVDKVCVVRLGGPSVHICFTVKQKSSRTL